MLRHPNLMRQAFGPGWALVGDAGYHRDAVTAHGISDAFRDAELLAVAAAARRGTAVARRCRPAARTRPRRRGSGRGRAGIDHPPDGWAEVLAGADPFQGGHDQVRS